MFLGLVGRAGVGKDTATQHIISKHNFMRIAFADPLKRMLKEIFEFSDQQLFGESGLRNIVDKRYEISPRAALQTIGSEGYRAVYENIWIEYLIRTINIVSKNPNLEYDQIEGIRFTKNKSSKKNFICSDIRFINEGEYIQKGGGYIIKINRESSLNGSSLSKHSSEQEVDDIPYDYLINNTGTYEEFLINIDNIMLKIIDNEAMKQDSYI